MEKKLKYYLQSFQHKGKPFAMAMRANGHKPTFRYPDVAFFDRPNTSRSNTQRFVEGGSIVIEYPHAPVPPWWYDGIESIPKYVSCIFVVGEAQKEAMKVIAPHANVRVCGFPWAEQLPFQNGKIKKILFAPIHPSKRAIRPEAREANMRILSALCSLKGYDIWCRTVGDRNMQGIKEVSNIQYITGSTDGSYVDIDSCDLVIAEGTYMFMAVARGKPVIGINQRIANSFNCETSFPKQWDKYGHLFAYPVDFDDAPLPELIDRARENQVQWKKRCMPEFNPKSFSEMVVTEYNRSKSNE